MHNQLRCTSATRNAKETRGRKDQKLGYSYLADGGAENFPDALKSTFGSQLPSEPPLAEKGK